MDLTREQIEQRRGLLINVLKRDGHDPVSVGIADTNTLCDMALRALRPEGPPPKYHLLVADWLDKRDATYSAALIRRYYEIDPPPVDKSP